MKFLKKIFMLLFYFVLSSVVFADFTTIELPSDFSISYKKDFSDKIWWLKDHKLKIGKTHPSIFL